MRRRGIAIVAAGAVALAAVAAWALWPSVRRPEAGDRLSVLFSGETLGELEPCNCSGTMAGGLPRRAACLAARPIPRLLVDTGCIGAGARAFERLRMEAALRGMAAMGYDAANVGEAELWLGRDGLAEAARHGVPFVSANCRAEGDPVAAPFLVFRCGGLDVAVTGLVDDAYAPGPGLYVDPPREALARLVPAMREAAGVLVVLADLREADVRDLAGDFPEIALILFRGRGDSHAPERVNRTIIASVYGEARYLGDVELTWESAHRVAAKGEAVLLDDRFEPDPAVAAATIGWYKAAVDGRTFDLTEPGPGSDLIVATAAEAGNAFTDPASCRACHPVQYKIWSAGPHARTMESLRKVDYDFSPECVACHVTGYGAADGYVSAAETPALARVGCDACHGRGERYLSDEHHAEAARFRGEATCRRCHAPKRHPEFDFAVHWGKISHEEAK